MNLQLAFGAITTALWFLYRFEFGAADTAEGTQTSADQKCIGRAELVRVVSLMLDGISHGVRSD